MGNPIGLEQFARLADRRLDSVLENTLKPYDQLIGQIFGTMPSTSSFVELFDIGSVPDIPVFTGKLDFLDIAPGFYTRGEPKEFAGGIQLQKKFIEDKQYGVLDDLQGGMTGALGRTKEKYAVKALAYATSTSWDFMTNEEGVSLASTAHTTKSGVSTASGFSNLGTTALDKTAVAATRILFRKFRDDIGELYDSEPDTLIVPESLYDTALEITGFDPKSGATESKDPLTAQWRISTTYKGFKVIPWRRLDDYSTTRWYMADSVMMKKFLLWLDRVKPEYATQVDFHTFAVMQSIRARFGWVWRNWRFLYCQNA